MTKLVENLVKYTVILAVLAALLWIGPGCTAYGIHGLVAGPGTEVKCGTAVMHDGDICGETRNGSSAGAKSYTEQRDDQNSFANRWAWPTVAVVMGGGITIAEIYVLWSTSQKRRRPETPQAP